MNISNNRVKGFLAIFALSLSIGVNAQDYDKAEAEATIKKYSQDWASVAVTLDPTPLEVIFADDFLGRDSQGRLYTKREFIDFIKSGPDAMRSNQVAQDELKVRFFRNIAIAQGYEDWELNGKIGRFYWTDIYEYRNGRWKLVAAQDMTSVPSASTSDSLFGDVMSE